MLTLYLQDHFAGFPSGILGVYMNAAKEVRMTGSVLGEVLHNTNDRKKDEGDKCTRITLILRSERDC